MPSDRKPPSTKPATHAHAPPAPAQGDVVRQDARHGAPATSRASDGDVAAFVAELKSRVPSAMGGGNGRLVFAMDATMSRKPTWDIALGLQAEMFSAVRAIGGLDVQLVYFRGAGECRASRWVSEPDALARLMTTVECRGGHTQIGKVLSHVRGEAESRRVNALVYVGDCMEENVDDLCARAGDLKLLGVPVFLFQEGRDATAESAFREIARLTGGAWCRFDAGAAAQLRELLTAVAVYAAGGLKALLALSDRAGGAGARRILAALPPPAAGPAKGQR